MTTALHTANHRSAAPSGAFSTHDGGNTWQPLTTDQSGGWLAGDFLAPDAGAVAGQAGRLATMQRHQLISSPLATSSLRSFRAMRLVAPTTGWAAGDGGLLMTTHDLGRSWQTPPTELPQSTSNQFDFHAIAVQGSQVWVAGSPGTRIFHSPDSGQTWDAATTGQTIPIRALSFVDANHGWASGELGSILSTSDGGHTWTVQRSGAKRAALLAIFSAPTDVPLELLAESGAADGYIEAVDILSSADAPSDADASIRTAAKRRSAAPSRRCVGRDRLAISASSRRFGSCSCRFVTGPESRKRWASARAASKSSGARSSHVAAGCCGHVSRRRKCR